jgi:hypothetical protein
MPVTREASHRAGRRSRSPRRHGGQRAATSGMRAGSTGFDPWRRVAAGAFVIAVLGGGVGVGVADPEAVGSAGPGRVGGGEAAPVSPAVTGRDGDARWPARPGTVLQPIVPVVPETATGRFVTAPAAPVPDSTGAGGTSQPASTPYAVLIEEGLPFTSVSFGSFVDEVLTDDRRGWGASTGQILGRSGGSEPQFSVMLASPTTADRLCAPLETNGRLSCRNGADVVINAWRWANGAQSYEDIDLYRTYVINHEVGHALGFPHAGCPAPGGLAPVMLQQTIGLEGCSPNPWPVTPAPR